MNIFQVALAVIATVAAATAANESDGDGLVVKTIKEAKSCDKAAEIGDRLRVHYVGRLEDEEGKIFDESRPRGQTFDFTLGVGQVIQGYERGVPGMCEGETRVLIVPPELGYGESGIQGVIPGGSTLHFTVELMKIEKGRNRDEV